MIDFDFMDDIRRADVYLNEDTWGARIGRAFGLTGVAILAGIVTLLITTDGAQASSQGACAQKIVQPAYSASFIWPTPRSIPRADRAAERRLLVGRSAQDKLIAQIWSGNTCEATCHTQAFEKDGPWAPVALQMECRSSGLETFASSATLLWGRGRSLSKEPTLRFGTWLQGYRQAPLRVKFDRYSMPEKRLAARSPAVAAR